MGLVDSSTPVVVSPSSAEGVPSHALCPDHPEVSAVATCQRCGRFLCETCREGSCPTCLTQALASLPALGGRAKTVMQLFYVYIGLEAVMALSDLLLSFEPDEGLLMVSGLVALGFLAVYVTTVVVYLRWLHLGVRTANALGHDIGFTPAAAVWTWFIPFLNLVRPYRAVKALLVALGGQGAVTQANLGLWWGLWIGGNVLANLSSRMTVNADGSISDAAGLISVLSAVVSIAGALACIHVIKTVQAHVPRSLACLAR